MNTSTRAAARQQEQEEQLGKLVSLVETQIKRLDEVADEQKRQRGELMEALQGTARQQQAHLEKLVGDYKGQLDVVMSKQNETEELVGALQIDVHSIKSGMHERLTSTEGKLEEFQGSYKSELGTHREELRAEVKAELQKLEDTITECATSRFSLRSAAPVFVPSEEPEGETVVGGAPRMAYKPATYDGKTAWDAYFTQFELLSQMNHWNRKERAMQLAVSLRGSAVTVLTNLPASRRDDYDALTSALRSRFGSEHQAELNRAKLRARMRQREETLPELAEDVERIARLAYPDAAEPMIETLAKDQFIDALQDEDMRLKLRQGRPGTLRETLELALELESYLLASRRTKPAAVREARLEKSNSAEGKREDSNPLSVELLQQLVDALQACKGSFSQKSQGQPSTTRKPGEPQTCWQCGEVGHFRRQCPKKRNTRATTPSSSQVSADVYKTGSIYSSGGNSLTVSGSVDGKDCVITVDTGSNISTVRPDLLRGESSQLKDSWLRTVTGERAPIHGKSTVQLEIGGLQMSHEMLIADISDECIIGLDLLEPYGC